MYILYQPGIASEESYPYEETYQHDIPFKCRYNKSTTIGTTTGYARMRPLNETLLKNAVAINPVSVALNAELDTFLFYR